MKNTDYRYHKNAHQKFPEIFTPDIFTRYKNSQGEKQSEKDKLPYQEKDLTAHREGETASERSRKDEIASNEKVDSPKKNKNFSENVALKSRIEAERKDGKTFDDSSASEH